MNSYYFVRFDNLPSKLPMKDKTRGRLKRELDRLPHESGITQYCESAKQEHIDAIKVLLEDDLKARNEQVRQR